MHGPAGMDVATSSRADPLPPLPPPTLLPHSPPARPLAGGMHLQAWRLHTPSLLALPGALPARCRPPLSCPPPQPRWQQRRRPAAAASTGLPNGGLWPLCGTSLTRSPTRSGCWTSPCEARCPGQTARRRHVLLVPGSACSAACAIRYTAGYPSQLQPPCQRSAVPAVPCLPF